LEAPRDPEVDKTREDIVDDESVEESEREK
jgi:hypothetical protein